MRLVLAALALATGVRAQTPTPTPRLGVAILPFDTPTNDSSLRTFAAVIAADITTQLAARRVIIVVDRSPEYVNRLLAHSVTDFAPARVIVMGDLSPVGDRLLLRLHAIDTETSETILSDSSLISRHTALLASSSFARGLAAIIGRFHPVVGATMHREIPTEALTAYSRGLLYRDRGDSARAIVMFKDALRVYPTYGEACTALRTLAPGESC